MITRWFALQSARFHLRLLDNPAFGMPWPRLWAHTRRRCASCDALWDLFIARVKAGRAS